jgi:hypothetical protein
MGGEYLNTFFYLYNCRPCVGIYDASTSRPPANIQQLMPVWNDPDTWNLNALNPLIRSYQIGVGEFGGQARRNTVASWVQDDWQITRRLTLNLGLRYDLQPNSFANFIEVYPILKAGRPNEQTDFGPRTGFAYTLNDRTVIRGGVGRYYGQVIDNLTSFTLSAATTFVAQVFNDGRPDFATNPFNGPLPGLQGAAEIRHRSEHRFRHCLSVHDDAVQLVFVSRLPATDRQHHGADVRLQLQRRASRAAHAEQPQSDLQPGHRFELSVHRCLSSSNSGLGADAGVGQHRTFELSRTGELVHHGA